MRPIKRLKLRTPTNRHLRSCTAKVRAATDPIAAAERLWERKHNSKAGDAAFVEVRSALRTMAHGVEACMYCEDSLGTDIEHFRPKSRFPKATFAWSNYLLACSNCNSNHKRVAFPVDSRGRPLLLNPAERAYDVFVHFTFVPETGRMEAETDRARESVKLFALNRETLCRRRMATWQAVESLLNDYHRAKLLADRSRMRDKKLAVLDQRCSSVLAFMVAMARDARARDALSHELRVTLAACAEVRRWAR